MGRICGGDSNIVVVSSLECVGVGARAAAAWFLLWAVRRTAAEPSGLGVSEGGIPGWQPSSVWDGVTCLPDEYQVNTEGPKPAKGLDEIL